MTHGSACWSDILNNRPPKTSTSSRCPSRAIKYPYTSIPRVKTSELKAQLNSAILVTVQVSGAQICCNNEEIKNTFDKVWVQHLGLFKLEDSVLSITRPEVDVCQTHQ